MAGDNIRVRFPPSPTGMLHVGGARTALFNWLFARHTGGTFILRIEDTDRARFDADAMQDIMDSLHWLGLDWDEGPDVGGEYGPYVQSERLDTYRAHVEQLLETGQAYKCYCTPERLAAMRERGVKSGYDRHCRDLPEEVRAEHATQGTSYVVRYRMPVADTTSFNDVIRGEITYPNAQQDDFVLLKTDGFPTYHLANVVDDHLMRITHVMRGEEWIPSTTKHVCLYQSFGWEVPAFAHLPVILAAGGGKLSKRHGAAAVREYREAGYLPDALVNFLALLGWSPGTDEELISRDTMVAGFTLEKVNKTAAQFDHEKLAWMNGEYLRALPLDEFVAVARPWLEQAGLVDAQTDPEKLRLAMKLVQERVKLLADIPDMCSYFFSDPIEYEEKAVRKFIRKDGVRENLVELRARLAGLADAEFVPATLEELVATYLEESEQPLKKVVHPLRVAVTGRSASPGIFDTLAGVGKPRVLARIDHVLQELVP